MTGIQALGHLLFVNGDFDLIECDMKLDRIKFAEDEEIVEPLHGVEEDVPYVYIPPADFTLRIGDAGVFELSWDRIQLTNEAGEVVWEEELTEN